MRKVFANQWFILATLLTIGLSAISYATLQKSSSTPIEQCFQKSCEPVEKADFLWKFLSRQLPVASF